MRPPRRCTRVTSVSRFAGSVTKRYVEPGTVTPVEPSSIPRTGRPPERSLACLRDDAGELVPVRLALVVVQRVRRELVLPDLAAAADVERGEDRAVLVDLDGRPERVGARRVEEVRDRLYAVVDVGAVGRGDDAAEVALLHPELWGDRKLAEQEGDDVVDRLAPRHVPVQLLGEVLREDAG